MRKSANYRRIARRVALKVFARAVLPTVAVWLLAAEFLSIVIRRNIFATVPFCMVLGALVVVPGITMYLGYRRLLD